MLKSRCPASNKLTIAVASSALVGSGAALPLVRRLLSLNRRFESGHHPVEVVWLARDDSEGVHEVRSIIEQGLAMSCRRVAGPASLARRAQTVNPSLFLSASIDEVREALMLGVPAARVFPTRFEDDAADDQLRIAFDFDGVLADDASEAMYQRDGLDAFQASERQRANQPLRAGPLARFCRELSALQRSLSGARSKRQPGDLPIRTSIVTSRGAPADTRVATTLHSWGVAVDEAFFLGGVPKSAVLAALRPHMFFDDQWQHVDAAADAAPGAHVPFGIANRPPICGGHLRPNSPCLGI